MLIGIAPFISIDCFYQMNDGLNGCGSDFGCSSSTATYDGYGATSTVVTQPYNSGNITSTTAVTDTGWETMITTVWDFQGNPQMSIIGISDPNGSTQVWINDGNTTTPSLQL
jgi:hypothetical protein